RLPPLRPLLRAGVAALPRRRRRHARLRLLEGGPAGELPGLRRRLRRGPARRLLLGQGQRESRRARHARARRRRRRHRVGRRALPRAARGLSARETGVRAPVALRVNPDVDPETHPYIATGLKTSKFGIPFAQAHEVYAEAASLKGVEVVGADIHIGSQLTKAAPLADAVARIAALVKTLRERSIEIRMVDVGGGLGIR